MHIINFFFFLMIRHPPRPPLFPYTTLFRSAPRTDALPASRREVAAIARLAGPDARILTGGAATEDAFRREAPTRDRKSTRLNSSHSQISYAVFCLKKKKHTTYNDHAITLH